MSLQDWARNGWLIEHRSSPQEIADLLDAFRKKRNVSDYERVGLVSKKEAQEMVALGARFRADAGAWLTENHPDLLKRRQ